MAHITIKGVIVHDHELNEIRFVSYLTPESFNVEADQFPRCDYTLIAPHIIEADAPDVDLIGLQLSSLDAKERELTAKYQAAKTAIEARRQSLLAIECSGVTQ